MSGKRSVSVSSRRRRRLGPALAAAAALTVGPAAFATPAGPGSPARPVSGSLAELGGVATVPGTDQAWAVGWTCSASADGCPAGHALILHWNGSSWASAHLPTGGSDDTLVGVAATGPDNAWAVGASDVPADRDLLLHWNGTAWEQKQAPALDGNQLSAIAATPSGAWAVGSYQPAGTAADRTLILSWTGTAWRQVPSPDPQPGGDQLLGVTAITPSDAWAVGSDLNSGTSRSATLVLRWSGSHWATATAPTVPTFGTQLNAVAAGSAADVWAVGQLFNFNADVAQTLALHWNGQRWAKVATPDPNGRPNWLFGTAVLASGGAWAVGQGPCVGPGGNCPSHTLTLRWTGAAWQHTASPSVADTTDANTLAGVAASSATNAWAVGSYADATGGPVRALLLRWNGTGWAEQ